MMGRTQALAGGVGGLALGAAVDAHPLLSIAAGLMGFASANVSDLDHPSARMSNSLGPVTWGLCWLIRHLSVRLTGRAHRGLSHSLLFCAVWGGLVGCLWLPLLSVQGAGWLALSAALGASLGVFADVLTKQGCEFVLWPARVQVSIPRRFRIRTGGTGERRIFVALMIGGVLLVPAALT